MTADSAATLGTAFDVLLALLLIALALRLLASSDIFEAIVLFVSFGLGMALVWVRLGAVDVALAEIALGAGLTGALLVNTMRRLERKNPEWLAVEPGSSLAAVVPVACGAIATAAALGVVAAGRAHQPLGPLVLERAAETGVAHPVTAVLLGFRAYDTLLEVAVLLAALAGVWALERGRPAVPPPAGAAQEPVLAALVRGIVPLTVIAAVYLTWLGSYAPGGAFQAGALLAGAGVLLLAAGFLQPVGPSSRTLRVLVVAGVLVFAGAALHTAIAHDAMLRYPPARAGLWILAIEAALATTIAVTLAELFVDVPAGPPEHGPERER
jgi:multisubunit Na+/H+ antiporter MnhB subunit